MGNPGSIAMGPCAIIVRGILSKDLASVNHSKQNLVVEAFPSDREATFHGKALVIYRAIHSAMDVS